MAQRVDRKAAPSHGPSGRRPAKESGGSASFDLCPSKLANPAQRRGSLRRRRSSRAYAAAPTRASSASRRRPGTGRPRCSPSGRPRTTAVRLGLARRRGQRPCGAPELHRDGAERGRARRPASLPRGRGGRNRPVVDRRPSARLGDRVGERPDRDRPRRRPRAQRLARRSTRSTRLRCTSRRARCSCSRAAERPRSRSPGIRASGELLEIGPAELALTDSQAAALLADAGVDVSDDERMRSTNGQRAGRPVSISPRSRSRRRRGPASEQFAGDDRFVADYLRSEHLAHLKPERDRVPHAHLRPRPDDGAVLRCGPRSDRLGEDAGGARAREPVRRRTRPPQRLVPLPPPLPRDAARGARAREPDRSPSSIVARPPGASRTASRTGRSTIAPRRGTSTRPPRWWQPTPSLSTATAGSRPWSGGSRRSTSRSCSRATPRSPCSGPGCTACAAAGRRRALGARGRELALRGADARRKSSLRPWAALVRRSSAVTASTQMRVDAELAIDELSPQSPWMPIA